jgi:hypothetical protein
MLSGHCNRSEYERDRQRERERSDEMRKKEWERGREERERTILSVDVHVNKVPRCHDELNLRRGGKRKMVRQDGACKNKETLAHDNQT